MILFGSLSAISLLALFWHPDSEVTWNGEWVLHQCRLLSDDGGSNCIGQYELSFGNSGEEPVEVRLDWPVDLRHWSLRTEVLNLSADRQRTNDPDFSCDRTAARAACSIDQFAAGTLLVITLRCILCDRKELDALSDNHPQVTSQARVYRSDPRATLLFRRLSLIFGLFF
jgi:hypothetical protein